MCADSWQPEPEHVAVGGDTEPVPPTALTNWADSVRLGRFGGDQDEAEDEHHILRGLE